MRKIFCTAVFSVFALFLVSCGTNLSLSALNSNKVALQFSTDLSGEFFSTLKELFGGESPQTSEEFVSAEDVSSIFAAAGVSVVSAETKNSSLIEIRGEISDVESHPLSKCGIIQLSSKSLKITLGPKQFESFYSLLSEDGQGYVDLLMIPSLFGEVMSAEEYKVLVASVYGEEMAEHFVNSKLNLQLCSADKKIVRNESLTLGELFTLSKPKEWVLNFK